MSLINNKNWQHSRVLKSLLLIITLQLVVLQVKALSVEHAVDQRPCSEMAMSQAAHSHKSEVVNPINKKADSCDHCNDGVLKCDNSCHAVSLLTLMLETASDLIKVNGFLYPTNNKILIAILQRSTFKPPQKSIV